MINKRDVITLKIPFPNISSTLAVKSHMYICQNRINSEYSFVKCQTKKPYMIGGGIIKNFVEELPDIKRNPFKNVTVIDCDKLFKSFSTFYPASLKTSVRSDIAESVMGEIDTLISLNRHITINLNETDLLRINPSTRHIQK